MEVSRVVSESLEDIISSIEIDDLLNHIIEATIIAATSSIPTSSASITTASTNNNNTILLATTTTTKPNNRFSVRGLPIEVLAPDQHVRHNLVRNSSAILNHVNELNTRWDPSGPRSQTASTTTKRQRKKRNPASNSNSNSNSNSKHHRPSTAPDAQQLEPDRKPDRAYKLHRAKIRRRQKEANLVGKQRDSGVIGLRGLLEELRYRKGSLGIKQRTSVVHIERPLMHTLKECFIAPPSAPTLLGAALSFEALVQDKTTHIEVRTRQVVDAAGKAAQSRELLSERNQRTSKVQHGLGLGWRTMRALVSTIGRLTDDDSGNSNKHNRQFCLKSGGLVILVRAIASDLWSSMCRKMQKHHRQQNGDTPWLPQWDKKKTKPSVRQGNMQDDMQKNMSETIKNRGDDEEDITVKSKSNSNSKFKTNNNLKRKQSINRSRPATVAVEKAGQLSLSSSFTTKKNRRSNRQKRPLTVPHRRINVKKNMLNKSRRRGSTNAEGKNRTEVNHKTVRFNKDKEGQILKKQTQLDAMRLLTVWAADDTLRPLLAIGRVLEAALLITGGREKQLAALDNDGKGRPLTMGRPKYVGTELQIAANRLLLTFTQADFEAMESADRRQAIDRYAIEADEKLTTFLLPNQNLEKQRPATSSPVIGFRSNYRKNIFGRVSEPPKPVSVLDMSGAPLAFDGDRSRRPHGDRIAVWEVFREGMMNSEVRARIRQLWRDEIEFRRIIDERDHRLDGAIIHARKLNLQYTEKKLRLNRLARIENLCSPEGRMDEARKLHGLNWKDPTHLWGRDSHVRRNLLGLNSPEPEPPSNIHHHHPVVEESEPEPEPEPFVQPDYFGRCADFNGRAWWENLVVKKKRPTREYLQTLPYDISLDIEEVETVIEPVFIEVFQTQKINGNAAPDAATGGILEMDRTEADEVDEVKKIDDISNQTTVESLMASHELLMPVLRPSTAPDTGASIRHVGLTDNRPTTSGNR